MPSALGTTLAQVAGTIEPSGLITCPSPSGIRTEAGPFTFTPLGSLPPSDYPTITLGRPRCLGLGLLGSWYSSRPRHVW
jgi:hypothetical protein